MRGTASTFASKLVSWYRNNHAVYPWRQSSDPYTVWLSEVLLQQTRIAVVLQYYERILDRFPSVQHLAKADDQQFLSLWSGVGYYRRGRMMLECAREITQRYGGQFPRDLDALISLPGIGRYTAGAIRNICFSQLTPAIDGNIGRVLARISNVDHQSGTARFTGEISQAFLKFGRDQEPGEFFQALMELGEHICLPRPRCAGCPVHGLCAAYRAGTAADLPRKADKKKRSTFHWYFLLLTRNNRMLFSRNRERQFLREAWLFPDLLDEEELLPGEIRRRFSTQWGIELSGVREKPVAKHAVTFRNICAHAVQPTGFRTSARCGRWLTLDQLKQYPTSSIVHKVLRHEVGNLVPDLL